LSDFKIIEAETKMPGTITKLRTGLEVNCKYSNFQAGNVTREQYLLALQKCIEQAEKPILVHVNSFNDLPSEHEVEKYNLNIMTQEKLKQLQAEDSIGSLVQKFKQGQMKILYSTKCNRGADFPGETCNTIILTKYPYPDVNSLFWRILKKTRPQHYTSFYMDKANREFLQRIYRGLRSENDHITLASPDIRVLDKSDN
ncbi:MAG: helicase C-terminal domain-containing protein, partial [Nanoarchaeota archaeon]